MHVVWEAMRVWSRIWDLNKPVLVEKTPNWYQYVELLHHALTNFSEPWSVLIANRCYAISAFETPSIALV